MEFRVLIASLNDGNVPVESYGATEHLGLAYLTAALREAGFIVKLIDAYATNAPLSQVVEDTVAFSPHLIGVTAEYNTFENAVEFCRLIKKRFKNIFTCIGGEHATFASDEILSSHPEIDFVVRGEGELTIVEAGQRLSAGTNLKGVPGIYFRDTAGGIIRNEDRQAIDDLDRLPFPSRDTLEQCLRKGIQPAISLLSSRGCHGHCNFCNASRFFNLGGGKSWRARSPENIVSELKYLLQKYENSSLYPVVYFADENFIGPGKEGINRARKIAELVIQEKLNIAFEIFCRADSFNGEEDTVKLLKQAGLTSALVGLESAKQRGLNILSKKTTVQQNMSTLQLFQKYNIITSSSGFLMFNPYSDVRDLIDNANFLLEIGQATIYNMSLKVLLYPGIRITDTIRNEGLIEPDFRHYRVNRYRFVNAKVATIAEAINSIDTGTIKREDATLRHLDFTIARMKDLLGVNDNHHSDKSQIFQNALQLPLKLVAELNSRAHAFFVGTVKLADTGWNQSTFTEFKDTYLRSSGTLLDRLNSEFQESLEKIEGMLA